jgi:antitoxin (DNA-binding transcriptional repressor) of toxin-antitoxin stability system
MSLKVSLHEVEHPLPALLQRVATNGEECVVQRNGRDYAVIVSVQQWRRRTVGRQLDAQGASLRLDQDKQARAEELLAARATRRLTAAERRELRALMRESDLVLRRRTAAVDRLP